MWCNHYCLVAYTTCGRLLNVTLVTLRKRMVWLMSVRVNEKTVVWPNKITLITRSTWRAQTSNSAHFLFRGIVLYLVYLHFVSLFFLNVLLELCSQTKSQTKSRLLLFALLKSILVYLTVFGYNYFLFMWI